MALVFSVFASEIKKAWNGSVSNERLVNRLYACVLPDDPLEIGKDQAFRLIKGSRQVDEEIKEKIHDRDTLPSLATQLNAKIIASLNPGKCDEMLVTLREIVASDSSIDDRVKKAMEKCCEENKPHGFLAYVFRHVLAVPNRTASAMEEELPFSESDDEIPQSIVRYLEKAKEKYSALKTLLYSDQPRPFYGFYVCNELVRKTVAQNESGAYYRVTYVQNATVEKLKACSRFTIITGTGGLGKSMMMRHLLLNAIDSFAKTGCVPVFVPIKDYTDQNEDLFSFVFEKVHGLHGRVTKAQLEALLEAGKCLVLLDGLDELGSAYATSFERALEKLTDRFPENMYVISSRPYSDFISLGRFTKLELRPFKREQALELVDKLEFRPDEPAIKEKFRAQLVEKLFDSHREFTENPLLLTIMLMSFEQFADIPSKMHIFYKEAFLALAQKHDASKGAYTRAFKTGLTPDRLSDYFAEFCARSYRDERYEMTQEEAAAYYGKLNERSKHGDDSTTVAQFLEDLTAGMCLMFYEGGKYHFTHRSFQEYFCALFFSKQKDKNLKAIGDFFESRRRASRFYGVSTFGMMYDMIPAKVEEYIFLPFLSDLFEKCDKQHGYWTFLELMYPDISYIYEDDRCAWTSVDPRSFLCLILTYLNDLSDGQYDFPSDFPFYEELIVDEFVQLENGEIAAKSEITDEYVEAHGEPEEAGYAMEVSIKKLLAEKDDYRDMLRVLKDDRFPLKHQYLRLREYHKELQENAVPEGPDLFDMF